MPNLSSFCVLVQPGKNYSDPLLGRTRVNPGEALVRIRGNDTDVLRYTDCTRQKSYIFVENIMKTKWKYWNYELLLIISLATKSSLSQLGRLYNILCSYSFLSLNGWQRLSALAEIRQFKSIPWLCYKNGKRDNQ